MQIIPFSFFTLKEQVPPKGVTLLVELIAHNEHPSERWITTKIVEDSENIVLMTTSEGYLPLYTIERWAVIPQD